MKAILKGTLLKIRPPRPVEKLAVTLVSMALTRLALWAWAADPGEDKEPWTVGTPGSPSGYSYMAHDGTVYTGDLQFIQRIAAQDQYRHDHGACNPRLN